MGIIAPIFLKICGRFGSSEAARAERLGSAIRRTIVAASRQIVSRNGFAVIRFSSLQSWARDGLAFLLLSIGWRRAPRKPALYRLPFHKARVYRVWVDEK